MNKYQFLILGPILFFACNSLEEYQEMSSPQQPPILPFERISFEPIPDTNDDSPCYLKLHADYSFEYFSMPAWSCYLLTELDGQWNINSDTLILSQAIDEVLYPDLKEELIQYKIAGEKLELIPNNKLRFLGIEPLLITNTNFQKLIQKPTKPLLD